MRFSKVKTLKNTHAHTHTGKVAIAAFFCVFLWSTFGHSSNILQGVRVSQQRKMGVSRINLWQHQENKSSFDGEWLENGILHGFQADIDDFNTDYAAYATLVENEPEPDPENTEVF